MLQRIGPWRLTGLATPLEMSEVQTGSYLGEDDIVRFEDIYGRGGDNPA